MEEVPTRETADLASYLIWFKTNATLLVRVIREVLLRDDDRGDSAKNLSDEGRRRSGIRSVGVQWLKCALVDNFSKEVGCRLQGGHS